MELKDYQIRALDDFSKWLDALAAARTQSEAVVSVWPEAGGYVPDSIRNVSQNSLGESGPSGRGSAERGRVC